MGHPGNVFFEYWDLRHRNDDSIGSCRDFRDWINQVTLPGFAQSDIGDWWVRTYQSRRSAKEQAMRFRNWTWKNGGRPIDLLSAWFPGYSGHGFPWSACYRGRLRQIKEIEEWVLERVIYVIFLSQFIRWLRTTNRLNQKNLLAT